MTIEERLGVAISSDNLTPHEHACPLDKIIVLGYLSRKYHLADGLIALKYANDGGAYRSALLSLRRVAAKIDRRHGWRLGPRLMEISKVVLDYWLNDVCAECSGAGHRAIDGAPGRAAKACHSCQGTGKRPRPWVRAVPRPPRRKNAAAMEAYRKARARQRRVDICYVALLHELDDTERRIGTEAQARLR